MPTNLPTFSEFAELVKNFKKTEDFKNLPEEVQKEINSVSGDIYRNLKQRSQLKEQQKQNIQAQSEAFAEVERGGGYGGALSDLDAKGQVGLIDRIGLGAINTVGAVGRGVTELAGIMPRLSGFVARSLGMEERGKRVSQVGKDIQESGSKLVPSAFAGSDVDAVGVGGRAVEGVGELLPSLALFGGAGAAGRQIGGMAAARGLPLLAKAAPTATTISAMTAMSLPNISDLIEESTGEFKPGTALAVSGGTGALTVAAFGVMLNRGAKPDAAAKKIVEMARKGTLSQLLTVGKDGIAQGLKTGAAFAGSGTLSNMLLQVGVKPDELPSFTEALKAGVRSAPTGFLMGAASGVMNTAGIVKTVKDYGRATILDANVKAKVLGALEGKDKNDLAGIMTALKKAETEVKSDYEKGLIKNFMADVKNKFDAGIYTRQRESAFQRLEQSTAPFAAPVTQPQPPAPPEPQPALMGGALQLGQPGYISRAQKAAAMPKPPTVIPAGISPEAQEQFLNEAVALPERKAKLAGLSERLVKGKMNLEVAAKKAAELKTLEEARDVDYNRASVILSYALNPADEQSKQEAIAAFKEYPQELQEMVLADFEQQQPGAGKALKIRPDTWKEKKQQFKQQQIEAKAAKTAEKKRQRAEMMKRAEEQAKAQPRPVETAKLQPGKAPVQIVDKSGKIPEYKTAMNVSGGDAARIEKRLTQEKPSVKSEAESNISEEELDRLGLVRKFGDYWQYRFDIGGKWYYANDKGGAIEQAKKTYLKTPKEQRLTPKELGELADKKRLATILERYKNLSASELKSRLNEIDNKIKSLRKAGTREFTGAGTRRTSAAVSNEAARELAQERLDIEFLLNQPTVKQPEPAAAQKPAEPVKQPSSKYTVEPFQGGFRVLDKEGKQYSWHTSRAAAEGKAGELNQVKPELSLAATKTVDWGKQKQQGKRVGHGMVIGGMGDITLQGKKEYTDYVGKLPKSEYDEVYATLGDEPYYLKMYAKARAEGKGHDESINLVIAEQENQKSPGEKYVRVEYPRYGNEDFKGLRLVKTQAEAEEMATKLLKIDHVSSVRIDGKPFVIKDPAEVQKIKNDIQEGELILRTGKFNGKKYTKDQLDKVRKSVNRSRQIIGMEPTAVELQSVKERMKERAQEVNAKMDAAKAGNYYERLAEYQEKVDAMPYTGDIDRQLAMRSHQGTSFSPERRAYNEIESYSNHLQGIEEELQNYAKTDEQKAIAKEQFENYRAKYKKLFSDYLSAHSRVLSAMITGPARFPTRRNEAASNAADNKIKIMQEFRKKFMARAKREIDPTRNAISSDRADAAELLQEKVNKARANQEMMKAANKIAKSAKLSDAEKIKQLSAIPGITEATAKTLLEKDYMGRVGFAPYQMQNNLANIKRLEQRISEIEKKRADETTETKFDGGTIIDNVEDNRLQILFDEKPSAETISQLKKSGFRWSPKAGAWQRMRSRAANYEAEKITGATIEKPSLPQQAKVSEAELERQEAADMQRIAENKARREAEEAEAKRLENMSKAELDAAYNAATTKSEQDKYLKALMNATAKEQEQKQAEAIKTLYKGDDIVFKFPDGRLVDAEILDPTPQTIDGTPDQIYVKMINNATRFIPRSWVQRLTGMKSIERRRAENRQIEADVEAKQQQITKPAKRKAPETKPITFKPSEYPAGKTMLTEDQWKAKNKALAEGRIFGKIQDLEKFLKEFSAKNKRLKFKIDDVHVSTMGMNKKVYERQIQVFRDGKKQGHINFDWNRFEFVDGKSSANVAYDLNQDLVNFKTEIMDEVAPNRSPLLPSNVRMTMPSSPWGKKPSKTTKLETIQEYPDGFAVDAKWVTNDTPPKGRGTIVKKENSAFTRLASDFAVDLKESPKMEVPLLGGNIQSGQVYFVTDGKEGASLIDGPEVFAIMPISEGRIEANEYYFDYDLIKQVQSIYGGLSFVALKNRTADPSQVVGQFVTPTGKTVLMMPTDGAPKRVQARKATGKPLFTVEYLAAKYAAKGIKAIGRILRAGVNLLRAGVNKFAQWARKMSADFGRAIHKHLRSMFNDAKALVESRRGAIKTTGFQKMAVVNPGNRGNQRAGSVYTDEMPYRETLNALMTVASEIEADLIAEGVDPKVAKAIAEDRRAVNKRENARFKQRQLGATPKAEREARQRAEQEFRDFFSGITGNRRGAVNIDAVRAGGRLILDGMTKFADWSKAMLKKFPGMVAPAARKLYARLNQFLKLNRVGAIGSRKSIKTIIAEQTGMKKPEDVKAISDKAALKRGLSREATAAKKAFLSGIKEAKARVTKAIKSKYANIEDSRNMLKDFAMKALLPADRSAVLQSMLNAKTPAQFAKIADRILETAESRYRKNELERFRKLFKETSKLHSALIPGRAETIGDLTESEINALLKSDTFTESSLRKIKLAAQHVKAALKQFGKTDLNVPDFVMDGLREISDDFGPADLNAINDGLEYLGVAQKLINKATIKGQIMDASMAANQIVKELPEKKLPQTRETTQAGFARSYLKPVTAINSMDGYNLAGSMGESGHDVFYRQLDEGQDKSFSMLKDGYKFKDDLEESLGGDKWRDYLAKPSFEVTASDGQKFQLNNGEKLYVIALAEDPQTAPLIENSGFVFGDKADSAPFKIGLDQIDELRINLTASERLYINELRRHINTDILDKNNQASQNLEGYILVEGNNQYFPRARQMKERAFLGDKKVDMLDGYQDMILTAEHMPFLKGRVQTGNIPFKVRSIDKVFDRHLNESALYYGMAEPLRNISRIMNMPGFERNIARTFGIEFIDRLKQRSNLIAMQSRHDTSIDKTLMRMLRNAAPAKLTPRSFLKQFSSVPAASTIIPRKYLAMATVNPKTFGKKTYQRMIGSSPLAYMRYRNNAAGIFVPGVFTWEDQNKVMRGLKGFQQKMLQLPAAFDGYSLQAIFRAAELWAEAEGKPMEWAVEKFEEAVKLTQNTMDVVHATGWQEQARQNIGPAIVGMFKAQPMKNTQNILRSWRAWRSGKKSFSDFVADYVSIVLGNAAINSVVVLAVGALLGKTLTLKDSASQFLDELVDTVFTNPLGNTLIDAKDLSRQVQGERPRKKELLLLGDVMAIANAIPQFFRDAAKEYEKGKGENRGLNAFFAALKSSNFIKGMRATAQIGGIPTWPVDFILSSKRNKELFLEELDKAAKKAEKEAKKKERENRKSGRLRRPGRPRR